ncbi:MAG: type VI secretion system baseplate subunit TssE [Desulfatitalea sp.]|nr:type VI secretion system baseplate subunit TssE [Desulfatitalea sp.]NNK01210.1 type VI secretion system baseplate subunit TssE [Desulfatitalea sp.]
MPSEKQHLQLSIFDRLSPEPGAIGETVEDVVIVRRAVLRDVENLLNTRRAVELGPDCTGYLKNSLYSYGIEDYTAKNPKNPQVRQALKHTIKEALTRFEPRLKNTEVTFNPEEGSHHNLCFAVTATLHADPVREPITFDTWFSAGRGEYKIKNAK